MEVPTEGRGSDGMLVSLCLSKRINNSREVMKRKIAKGKNAGQGGNVKGQSCQLTIGTSTQ